MTALEHLLRLEAAHGIDREKPKRILERARDTQARLEELAEKHSCELPAWTELASTLEDRRNRASDAVDCVVAETMELDEGVFGTISKADCLEILRSLKDEFARALEIRRECARALVAIAGAYREGGYSGSEIVDNAIRGAIAEVRRQANVPEAVAAEYVAQVVEFCGIAPLYRGAYGAQFPDLTALLEAEPGATLEEIANRVQQKALGLWPEEGG